MKSGELSILTVAMASSTRISEPSRRLDLDAVPKQGTLTSFQIMSQSFPMLLTHSFRDNQSCQLLTDGLGAAETECALGRGIEFTHATVCVHRDNAVERRFNDRTTD